MKKWLALSLVIFTISAKTAVYAGEEEYNDCLLQHLKGAKLDVVAAMIREACYENYQGFLNPGEKVKKYNECLLEHLVDVESFQAAMEIRNACGGKYLM